MFIFSSFHYVEKNGHNHDIFHVWLANENAVNIFSKAKAICERDYSYHSLQSFDQIHTKEKFACIIYQDLLYVSFVLLSALSMEYCIFRSFMPCYLTDYFIIVLLELWSHSRHGYTFSVINWYIYSEISRDNCKFYTFK